MNIPAELSTDETKLKAAAAAALASARADAIADEGLAKTWLHANLGPAIAIAIGFLVLGIAIGAAIAHR
jgi:hypothetical protein